jgi:superfamily II DNA or RNA helicase
VSPYLCDQWHKELAEKFHFEPIIVGSGTIGYLERRVPRGRSFYDYYPVQVISIDFIKRERNKYLFLQEAPELIVVDEVHGAVPAGGRERHLRYELVRELAADPRRHLILLTATPHSGIQEAFQKLLGLIDPEFEGWDFRGLDEGKRARLARHFIQRTRADIKSSWDAEGYFPERDPVERTYRLSPLQRELYERTRRFCMGIVRRGQELTGFRRRMHYWSALALLRCVMSSPQAAQAALRRRRRGEAPPEEEAEYDLSVFAYERTDERGTDEAPAIPFAEETADSEATALRRLEALARAITPDQDPKLQGCIEEVRALLREGFRPVIWCFFVDTAEYVAEALRRVLSREFRDLEVLCVTGRMDEEERRRAVEELMGRETRRVLVATDCLSEGINLQEGFDAVLHYDLPWNPNRLEQREGRVDRFGQKKNVVRVVRYYGTDNPVDGAILQVLLKKAWEIYKTLKIYVPVPIEEESVLEALVNALFTGPAHRTAEQMALEFLDEKTKELHNRWDLDAKRERESRTRFAQRRIKPHEVYRELEAADKVLGGAEEVCEFVLAACQRIGLHIERDPGRPSVWRIPLAPDALANVPELVRWSLPRSRKGAWHIAFHSPTPEGAEFVGRNHPFVTALAQYLFEGAISGEAKAASRCGAIRTDAVDRLTSLYLLRTRYLLEQPRKPPLLCEEVLVLGQRGFGEGWIPREEALRLLAQAVPVANIPIEEKRDLVELALTHIEPILREEGSELGRILAERARELEEGHKRLRRTVGEPVRGVAVRPQWPPDLLGVLVLQPVTKG